MEKLVPWTRPCVARIVWMAACLALPAAPALADEAASTRLPGGVLPVLGCWFWHEPDFAPEGYRPFLDMTARHATFNLLTTSLRVPQRELTDAAVHDQIKLASADARRLGMGIVMDLDVRLARAAFRRAHPDELQEMLRLREVALAESGTVALRIVPEPLSDHYTAATTPYVALSGRLVRVYAYRTGPEGIEPDTLDDVTGRCKVVKATAGAVAVEIPCDARTKGRRACVLAAFRHLAPDVFAAHLLPFQSDLIARYADCGLAGACKDEWGFPPCFDGCPAKNDFWYSEPLRNVYARRTGGRDLVRDSLLMYRGERGRQPDRQAAINHLMELTWQRNALVEENFYETVKATFGREAVVATHPTWWPNPDLREFKKNGLDWWAARRDWAQTDEVTPFCVRTALAKKWGSPVWYNMFYATSVDVYEQSLWSHALGGGRINYHPVYPYRSARGSSTARLLEGRLMRGDSRIRLLNFISRSPLDCPVAVVFGHACAMNWAGPAYDDVGLATASAFWKAGYPADLIPSSEVYSGLTIDGDSGLVRYGPQKYAAVLLYHPEFERPDLLPLVFTRAARGRTALVRVGDWTRGFDGRPFDGNAALPATMTATDAVKAVACVIEHLRTSGIAPQTPATALIGWGDRVTAAPARSGHCRLIDGTEIELAGTHDVAGDPIAATWDIHGRHVEFAAIGVAAVRLAADGTPEALAAGGLKRANVGRWTLALERPVDVALWRDAQGKYHGAIQDGDGPIPPALLAITTDWLRLAVPPPLPPGGGVDP
jgi:hypothetical protein